MFLVVQQALDLSGPVGANPAESGSSAGVEPERDVLAVRAPYRIGGLSVDGEARHRIALQVIDEEVPVGARNFRQRQPLAVGRKAGLQVEAWRGDQRPGIPELSSHDTGQLCSDTLPVR